MARHQDVVVVGGGLVGCVFSCLAAQQGARVTIIDKNPTPVSSVDSRVFALSSGSAQLLQSLKIWERLSCSPEPIRMVAVTQSRSTHVMTYTAQDNTQKPLGFMVPHKNLRPAIFQQTREQVNIQWCCPEELIGFTPEETGVTLRLKSGKALRASLLVGADGARSPLREKVGMKVFRHTYSQKALVCSIHHSSPHCGTAFEHFMPSGPLAVLPLSSGQSALVWSGPCKEIDALQAMPEQHFLQAFLTRFGTGLGAPLGLITERKTYPLNLIWCPRLIDQRLALIGDAGHSIHPVAGQGLNLGLRDAHLLGNLIGQHHHLGLDIGSPELLKHYQNKRWVDIGSMTLMTHGVVGLFSLQSQPMPLLREWGMRLIMALPSVKKRIAGHASGTSVLCNTETPLQCIVDSYPDKGVKVRV